MNIRSNGFTLVEVLVTLITLSIGLLGLAALQTSGLKFTHDAYLRSQATTLAYSVIEQMRLDRDNTLVTNSYSGTYSQADNSNSCNYSSSQPVAITNCWQVKLRNNLPAGRLVVGHPDGNNNLTLTISWQNSWQQRETTTLTASAQSWTVKL